MKLCLLMLVTQGEAPYLRLHLPVYKRAVDGIMVVWQRGQDTLDEANAIKESFLDAEWIERDFCGDWSQMLNMGIEAVEQSQCWYDALLRLDPDEAMFARD